MSLALLLVPLGVGTVVAEPVTAGFLTLRFDSYDASFIGGFDFMGLRDLFSFSLGG